LETKNKILKKLRRQIVDQVDLPEVVDGPWIKHANPADKFVEMVRFAGGECHSVSDLGQVVEKLSEFEQFRTANRVFSGLAANEIGFAPGDQSSVPAELLGNVVLDETEDPHDLENLDFVIYPGQLAVAENGAIWVTDEELRHRVVFFITQFLVLVVRHQDVVDNMHEAYSKIAPPQPGFGLFLSGPSKTADIEQSLVIGAHGCRELNVFIVGN